MKLLLTLLFVAVSSVPSGARAQRRSAPAVEDIYVARSVRISRVTPTDFCAESRTGFTPATYEDRYTFHTVTTRPSDGRITDALGGQVGQLHACFGETTRPLRANFYAEGELASLSFVGKGDCESPKADFPESGINVFRCFLNLTDLPRGYVGGLLTTNSVRSRKTIGPVAEPAGYVQSSIATVRLWKHR